MSFVTQVLPRFRQPALGLILAGWTASGHGQTAPNVSTNSPSQLPPVIITALKQASDLQGAPVSVTAVPREALDGAGARYVGDAAQMSPNTYMTEFSARKLSNPRFRGIGSSPNNPGVTTYIDGVPQFNANSSSLELIDVDQIDFVRGPQGALYGRNTVGGLIDIRSARPSLTDWTSGLKGSYGNHNYQDVRVDLSGPLKQDQVGLSLAGGYSGREGYMVNDITGNDLDHRSAAFGKGQLIFAPTENWDIRLILSGEHARDGDYALGDLAAIRARPFHVSRDFEGYTYRDVLAPTLLANYQGANIDFESITGVVWWKTADLTDLDYTPAPLITRQNDEKDVQFTHEFRLASSKDAPVQLGEALELKWQTGVFVFTQNYEQSAFNDFAPFVLSPFIPFPVRNLNTAELNDFGGGIYAQTTLTAWEKLDLTAGVRGDFESKEALLNGSFNPAVAPSTASQLSSDYAKVTPHFGVGYHLTKEHLAYATVTRGYKAGGFNATAPVGSEEYKEEGSWNYGTGLKTTWFDNRVSINLAAFYTHWDSLQLNVPLGGGAFYTANTGGAQSKGVELEIKARLMAGWDVFASAGYNDARFLNGSYDNNANTGTLQHIAGNKVPFAPDYTVNGGTQVVVPVANDVALFARADVTAYGGFAYDPVNGAGQSAYSIANLRAGVRGKNWSRMGAQRL
jgi:iron complex outermembrane receptor protein